MGSSKQVKYGRTIVLVGFMGGGKTTLGRRLARNLGVKFVDLDEEIEKRAGQRISEIFKKKGEKGFRRLETQALARALKTAGVVATGGGLVTQSKNRRVLK